MAVAYLREARRHRRDGEVLGDHIGNLIPIERRRDRGARLWPHAVGGGDCPISGVLVVVDEDPLAALFLPPLRRDPIGHPPLEFAPKRDRGMPHVRERPAWLDTQIDV